MDSRDNRVVLTESASLRLFVYPSLAGYVLTQYDIGTVRVTTPMSDVARAARLYCCGRPYYPYDRNTFFLVARNNLTALKRITTGPETFFP